MANVARSTATSRTAQDSGQQPAMFARTDSPTETKPASEPGFQDIQGSREFRALRSRLRRFIFPMAVLFFLWYMTYVVLAAYAHDFMSIKVIGDVNIGIIMGVLQFVSTVAITAAYIRFANNKIDPQVAQIRRHAGVSEHD